MQLGRFRISIPVAFLSALTLALLLGLGFWQLDRAEQKRRLLADYASRAGTEPVRLSGGVVLDASLRYQPAEASGRYDGAHQFLLDNKVYRGRAGYQVLTPLRLAGCDCAVLVNRGWVAQGRTRQDLPAIEVAAGERRVRGILYFPPDEVFVLGEGEDRAPGWPKVLQRIRLDLQAGQLGYALLPAILLLDPDAPDGYVRDWRPVVFGPERHVGYAVQWFSLAAALVILVTLAACRRSGDEGT